MLEFLLYALIMSVFIKNHKMILDSSFYSSLDIIMLYNNKIQQFQLILYISTYVQNMYI